MLAMDFDCWKPADRERVIRNLDEMQLVDVVTYMSEEQPEQFAGAIEFVLRPEA
jgi:hypothetical protein